MGTLGIILIVLAALLALYILLFLVFFFDLDGKLIYKVVEPALCKRYDKMKRKNPLDQEYSTEKPDYKYNV